jgi:hypothetical protein
MTVGERFDIFLSNLQLTSSQFQDGKTKHEGVRYCLNRNYYDSYSSTENSFLVGSWGKSTEIRPPRDIDIMFVLPDSVYRRYQQVAGNKQSQLLQEVRGVLQKSYPNTKMRADGQVVMVPFESYAIEVAPAFLLTSGQFWICDTNNGGSYKVTDPAAEISNVKRSNDETVNNTRHLIRMLKRWQEYCSVPMKSFWLELLAINFLSTWEYRGKGTNWYDWMVRDFFRWLHSKGQTAYNFVTVPGTAETIWIGSDWASKAESAKGRAEKACEDDNGTTRYPCLAGEEWQKIFGDFIPKC